ncbi:MAG TPA: MgtC/SapB family protein [Rhodopila sp.]
MSATLSWMDVVLRLGCAIAAGFLIGLDRGEHAQPAGLRTTVLISVAAALAMLQANWLVVHMNAAQVPMVSLDMMRLPLGILSGIGFIGAGVILRREEIVRGVTTAATIWLVTVLGLCFGGGQIGIGIAGTAIGLATLWLLKYVEAALITRRRGTIAVTVAVGGLTEPALLALLAGHGFAVRWRRTELTPGVQTRFECSGRYSGRFPEWSSNLMRDLSAQPGVSRLEWQDTD